MDTPPTAIIDACVLYSAPVRDLLVRLAQAGLIQAPWTAEIHDEWMRNVLKNNPKLTRERLERTRYLMDESVRDCLVTGYADLVDSLTLPDRDDRHVLAAAIRGGADVIVTYNLGDFPADALTAHGIEARHPDEFIAHLLDVAPTVVTTAAKCQREGLKNPPRTVDEFLAILGRGRGDTVCKCLSCISLLRNSGKPLPNPFVLDGFVSSGETISNSRQCSVWRPRIHRLFVHQFSGRSFGGSGIDLGTPLGGNSRRFPEKC